MWESDSEVEADQSADLLCNEQLDDADGESHVESQSESSPSGSGNEPEASETSANVTVEGEAADSDEADAAGDALDNETRCTFGVEFEC